jgi:hypothetical protein
VLVLGKVVIPLVLENPLTAAAELADLRFT